MQDRYFGDVGDFAKFGLLRHITANHPELRLGILWYLVPDESHTNDGRHIAYLDPSEKNRERFRTCDPDLYDKLSELVRAGKRTVSVVVGHSILPRGTVYHDEPLVYRGILNGDRRSHRERWVARSHQAASPAGIVLLDPDNGLEVGCDRHAGEGPKYAFYDDLTPLRQAGKTVIIYQHANREGSFLEQIQGRLSAIQSRLGPPPDKLLALRWRRISARAFLFVMTNRHSAMIEQHLRTLLAGPWGAHFELVRPKV